TGGDAGASPRHGSAHLLHKGEPPRGLRVLLDTIVNLRHTPRHGCYSKPSPGKTGVCSLCTACNWSGSRPSALRIVGAICVVCTAAGIVAGASWGFDTSSSTLVSSRPKPPCSAIFLPLVL